MPPKADATKAAEAVAVNAAAITSVNGKIAKLQQDMTAANLSAGQPSSAKVPEVC